MRDEGTKGSNHGALRHIEAFVRGRGTIRDEDATIQTNRVRTASAPRGDDTRSVGLIRPGAIERTREDLGKTFACGASLTGQEAHTEMRHHLRLPLHCPVIFSTDDVVGEGRIVDLGVPGCAVHSEVVPAPGRVCPTSHPDAAEGRRVRRARRQKSDGSSRISSVWSFSALRRVSR